MDATRRTELIEVYRSGVEDIEEALDGVTDAELDRSPGPGEWSPREIAVHLADAELRAAIRLRQLLAEDAPTIQGYDEEDYARRLTRARTVEVSLRAVRGARESTAELLTSLSDDEWVRRGTHTESGPYSVETWLEIYAAHAHDHADQIRRARTK